MIAKIKNWGICAWVKKRSYERKRYKDLKEIAKQERLWDMRLRGER
jgi:hypothetical protein